MNIFTVVHSNAMNGIAVGSTYERVIPAWQIAIRAAEITFGVIFGATIVMSALGIFGIFPKKSKED